MKELGALITFLGIQAIPHLFEYILTQRAYIHNILNLAGMSECHPTSTPTATKHSPIVEDQQLYNNSTLFRRLIDALQYLTITHPDITFTVNKLCQTMHKPYNLHFQQLK